MEQPSFPVKTPPILEPLDQQQLRDKAWIGDAILALYAREWILRQRVGSGEERREMFTNFTCNQFLSGVGEPTRVEARIGVLYETGGIPAAFDYISDHLLPLFLKQEKNRKRGLRGAR